MKCFISSRYALYLADNHSLMAENQIDYVEIHRLFTILINKTTFHKIRHLHNIFTCEKSV